MALDEDVPMALVDDDDDDDDDMEKVDSRIRKNVKEEVERRIRKEKEISLDDDYANLEKLKRKKKNLYIDDVDAVRVERMSRIENFPPDGVRGKMAQKNENQKNFSDDDLKHPSICLFAMKRFLPAMAETFRTKDWSLLRKYCFLTTDSSSTENLSFEEALQHELVATCFWFLLTKSCPPHVKECLVSALQFILFIAPKATNMPVDQEEDVDHVPIKMSIDQAFIDDLVVNALRLGEEEIIRQVSETMVYVSGLHLTDTVGTGIQSQLLILACSWPFGHDTRVATSVLRAINTINLCFEDGVMREKLVEAVLSDRKWLLNFMRDPHEEIVQEAYNILHHITRGGYVAGIWKALADDFIPQVLKRCGIFDGVSLRICAAMVISNTINGASIDQIDLLVYNNEDLLSDLLDFLDINDVQSNCLAAIGNILKAGEEESNFNMYAQMIGKHRGWDLLDEAYNAEDILVTYAPRKWLCSSGKYCQILFDRE